MKKLDKMNPWDSTIPIGQECACDSQLEAVSLAQKAGFDVDSMDIMLITTTNGEKPFCWCHMNDLQYTCFTIFKQDPPLQSPPKSGLRMQDGEFFRHGEDIYQILRDKDLGLTIRQVSIFDDTLKADVAYRMSNTGQNDPIPEDYPDYDLVRLTEIDKPNKPLCISWFIEKGNTIFLQPVFLEDFEEFSKTNRNNLNWEFLSEGDTFTHDNREYQICRDENDDYYIALLYPVKLRIAVFNR